MKLKNVFLTFSLTGFVIGFSDIGNPLLVEASLPLGAILFGLFMIFTVLEKETALFDQQNGSSKKEKISRRGNVQEPPLRQAMQQIQ